MKNFLAILLAAIMAFSFAGCGAETETPEEVVLYLYEHNIIVNEIMKDKIGLEEYYINLMERKEGR